MKNKNSFLEIIIDIFVVISLIFNLIWFYMDSSQITVTHNSTFISEVENANGSKIPFCEVSFLTADNGVGTPVFELVFNSLTDVNRTGTYSYGVQVINPKSFSYNLISNSLFDYYYEKSLGAYYYYNNNGVISFNATDDLRDNSGFLITIDSQLYYIKWTKQSVYYGNGGVFGLAKNYWLKNYSSFIAELYDMCESLDYGYTLNIMCCFDKYFDILTLDDGGKFTKEVTDTTLIDSISKQYIFCNVKKSCRGALVKEDSMFNCYYGNSTMTLLEY